MHGSLDKYIFFFKRIFQICACATGLAAHWRYFLITPELRGNPRVGASDFAALFLDTS